MSHVLRVREGANGVGIGSRWFYSAEWVCRVRAIEGRRLEYAALLGMILCLAAGMALGFVLGVQGAAAMFGGGV